MRLNSCVRLVSDETATNSTNSDMEKDAKGPASSGSNSPLWLPKMKASDALALYARYRLDVLDPDVHWPEFLDCQFGDL